MAALRKVTGVILVIIGVPLTLLYAMWPLTGNHGATWLEFLPILSVTGGVVLLGIFLIKYKPKVHDTGTENKEKI